MATAFIHLLAPAHEALTDECLTGVISVYPWVEGIVLMTIFVMFFLELMTMRYATFGGAHDHSHSHSHSHDAPHTHAAAPSSASDDISLGDRKPQDVEAVAVNNPNMRGEDHLGHTRDHVANSELGADWEARGLVPETYSTQLTAVFILEFGVIFHSIFVGLTLAVAGDEFITLYIVLVFHQTFEGLGLGARLAEVPWPAARQWTAYCCALGYGISTPIAIAVGLGIRQSFSPGSRTTLLVNGAFDSISAGILIYTGLVELMAHEFMFSPYMQKGPVSRTFKAFALMILGAGMLHRFFELTLITLLTYSRIDGSAGLLGIDQLNTYPFLLFFMSPFLQRIYERRIHRNTLQQPYIELLSLSWGACCFNTHLLRLGVFAPLHYFPSSLDRVHNAWHGIVYISISRINDSSHHLFHYTVCD